MANFTITITNAINTVGPAPSMRWGVDVWGTKWAVGTEESVTKTVKLLDNSVTTDNVVAMTVGFFRTITNALAITEDLTSEGLSDGSGYNVVFPGGSTNAEGRSIPTYSAAAAASTTYSSGTASSTPWS